MRDDLRLKMPGGRVLAYTEYGDADGWPVFCMHGTPGSRHLYAVADESARARKLRLIAPDRPGFGDSDNCPGWGFKEVSNDLAQLAEHLGIAQFSLLGFSGGGPHAAFGARTLAPRVSRLVLLSAYAPGERAGLAQQIMMSLARISPTTMRLTSQAAASLPMALVKQIICIGVNRSDRTITRNAQIRDCLTVGLQAVRDQPHGVVEEARLFAQPWELPEATHPDPRVWIWHGLEDQIVSSRAALRYSHIFTRARLTLLPGRGHYWGLERIDEVLDVLREDSTPCYDEET